MNPLEPLYLLQAGNRKGKRGFGLFTFIGLYSLNSSWREEGEGGYKMSERGEQSRLNLSINKVNGQQKEPNVHVTALTQSGVRTHRDATWEKERRNNRDSEEEWNVDWWMFRVGVSYHRGWMTEGNGTEAHRNQRRAFRTWLCLIVAHCSALFFYYTSEFFSVTWW